MNCAMDSFSCAVALAATRPTSCFRFSSSATGGAEVVLVDVVLVVVDDDVVVGSAVAAGIVKAVVVAELLAEELFAPADDVQPTSASRPRVEDAVRQPRVVK